MSNLATIVNNILADSGIDDINVVVTTGSYANPAWITSLAWTKITGAPANIVTGTGTANEITYWTGTSTIGSLSTATYPSLTELSYVKGVTSAIQTQLNGKLSLSGGTMTGVIGLPNGAIGIQVGDDATIADRNVANTMYVAGVQNTDRGYINFSESAGNQLGAINGGDLTWRGVPIITTSNVSGTVNYIPKFTAANTIGNSIVQDNGRVITITSTDGTGARTTLNDVLTITQLNPNAPYSGFGTGILFRGNTYVGNYVWGRIGMQLTDFSEQTTGENMIFQVAPADNSDTLVTALTLAYNSVATFSGSVGVGVTPTQTLDVNGNGKFRGQDFYLGSSVTADNVIYIYSKNGAESQIRTNAGVSASYNGMMIASNYNQANSLPSWSLDLGGALNSTSNVNTYTLGYRPFGGAWSSLMIVNATGAATFSGSITTTNGNIYLGSTSARIGTDGVSSIDFNYNTGGTPVLNWYGGTTSTKFIVTSAGAATFSSSVTSTGLTVNGAEIYMAPANYASGGFTRLLGRNSSTGRIEGMSAADVQAFIGLSSYISGSGTTNYVPKFTSSSAIGNSVIIDNGSDVTVGSVLRVNAYGNVAGGTIRMGVVNDSTAKWAYLVSTQYNSSTNPSGFSVIGAYSTATANQIVIGGSIYEANPATEIQFWTHTATTHATGGTKRMQIDTNGIATFYYGSIFNAPVSINGGSVPSDRWFEVTGTTSGKVFGAVFNPTFTYTGANIYGIYVGNNFGSGTITNSYNLYIEGTSVGSATITNRYGLYQAGGSDRNYFAGSLGVGTTTYDTKFNVYDLDGSGARTTPFDVVTITADNNSNPYDGFGAGLLFKNRIYSGGPSAGGIRDGARIRTSINTNSSVNYGTDLVFDATATGDGGLNEILRLSFNGVSTFTSSLRTNGVFSWNSGVGSLSYNTGVVTMETNSATRIELKTNGTTALTLQTNQNGRFANSLGIGRDPSHALDASGSIRGSDRLYWNGQSQLVYILNYDQIPNADTTTVADSTATNGFALRKSGGSSTFFFGNYTSFPPGNYTAYFRLKVASNASGSYLGQLDVVGANCIGFAISVLPNMFDASNTWQYIKLPFTITGGGYIEWRFVSWTGVTDTFFDHVMIYQEGGEGRVYTRNAYSVYVNQNTLGMQLNTSGALTVTSSVTATSFFESSDFRLKSEIQDLDIDVSHIAAKSYLKNGIQEIGYIAQDVESILPSAISKRDDGYLDLSYRQVHTAKIAYLEEKIIQLEKQIKK